MTELQFWALQYQSMQAFLSRLLSTGRLMRPLNVVAAMTSAVIEIISSEDEIKQDCSYKCEAQNVPNVL